MRLPALQLVAVGFIFSTFGSAARAAPSAISVVQSTADERFAARPALSWTTDDGTGIPTVTIYGGTTMQEIEGFGAAFTESAAVVLNRLDAGKRSEVLNKLFSPTEGIGYSLMRTPINSNDFALRTYSYDDDPSDTALDKFSIEADFDDLLPLIVDAQSVAGADFKIVASPWSAPAWMKDSNNMRNGGKLKVQHYDTWARFFLEYLQAYRFYGVDIWAVTAQNEPRVRPPWESMLYQPAELTRFINQNLGPTLAASDHAGVKIFSGDDQKNTILSFAEAAAAATSPVDYVYGIAAHWYAGDWFEQIDEASIVHPDRKVLATEATAYPGAQVDVWSNAERYVHDILGDLNYGAIGWIDWNLALDQDGGPNNQGITNPCSAPVIVSGGDYFLNPQYYAVGHFSRYVQSGAHKIGNITTGDIAVEAAAFANPSGEIVVVIYNSHAAETPIKLKDGAHTARLTLPASSITTLKYEQTSGGTYPATALVSLRASNGKYVSLGNGAALVANSTTVGNNQQFRLYTKPDGFVTLKARSNALYVSAYTQDALIARAQTASTQVVPNSVNPFVSFERFERIDNSDGTISFRALKNGLYVRADPATGALRAASASIGAAEKFTLMQH